MKRLAVIGFALALALSMGAVASASPVPARAAISKAKKKCKHGRVFRKGKCRPGKTTAYSPPAPPSPRSLVRGRLSVDGPASLDLVVADAQGRQADGNADEIPDTDFKVDGGSGHYTETFTDHIFYGDYNTYYYPSPGNRQFGYSTCYHGNGGPEPTHVDLMWVTASGLVNHGSWTINPSDNLSTTGCVTYIN